MSDTKNSDDKTISVERKKKLSLSRDMEPGTVRQSMSHGRSKSVVVEKKKRRMTLPGQTEAKAEAVAPVAKPPAPHQQNRNARKDAPGSGRGKQGGQSKRTGQILKTLTASESDARTQALRMARVREAEEKKQAEANAVLFAAEEAKRKVADEERRVAEEAAARVAAEQAEQKKTEEERIKAEEAKKAAAEGKTVDAPAKTAEAKPAPAARSRSRSAGGSDASGGAQRRTAGASAQVPAPGPEQGKELPRRAAPTPVNRPRPTPTPARPRTGDDRRKSKLSVTAVLNDDGSQQRGRSLAALRRRREKEKRAGKQVPREKIAREVTIPEAITIQELANRMAERSVDVIKLLMRDGQMLKINDVIDTDTAQLIAEEMGHTVKRVSEADVEEGLFETGGEDDGELTARAPVVTIMGHVDHGKTSLLDALRESNVASGEAGGITQHIGAYQVEQRGQKITFIDTPGHAAFTQMRARGAKATDVVVLVVAADDGVMPQTKEAIAHAKAADVPLIVAINKIDKQGSDPNRVRTELLQDEIVVESMGGEVLEVEVSALKGTNLDKLLDAILLQSELLELKANAERAAEGIVIEAKLDKGRGPVATVLVQRGTLRIGDVVIGGSEWGRVRALIDDQGNQVKEAGPAQPVEVLGFQATPEAGDMVAAVENEGRAREISEYRNRKRRDAVHARGARGSLEQMMLGMKTDGRKDFVLVIKGDVQGSVEAIAGALDKLGTEEVHARIVHAGVGGITESDITLAEASNAAILGFNVRANKQAREAADATGIELRYYNVIYDLVDDVKAAMSGMLSPERRETFLGNAEILEVFNISKVGKVAGCRVTEGVVQRGAHVRLIRDDVVVHEGQLGTLKRFKDEVKEVQSGQECGMNFETYQDMRAGDVIECYRVEEIARTL
ncbi:MAG: translation initiation factor IF-2 [Stappiaceae bacterium]